MRCNEERRERVEEKKVTSSYRVEFPTVKQI
jgi:hypothetical protein